MSMQGGRAGSDPSVVITAIGNVTVIYMLVSQVERCAKRTAQKIVRWLCGGNLNSNLFKN